MSNPTLPHSQPIWFDRKGYFQGEIPAECVADCSHAGPCDDDVQYWQERLDFTVPRDLAVLYLRSTGGYTAEDLAESSDTDIACAVLWIACCDMRESGEWYGLTE